MTTAVQGRDGSNTKSTITISVDPPIGERDELGEVTGPRELVHGVRSPPLA